MMQPSSKPDLGNALLGYALSAVVAAGLVWLFVMPAILTAAQQNNIMVLSLLFIPGFIFGSGIYSWWRRR